MTSSALKEFHLAQTRINDFLWSSELGLAMTRQKLIKGRPKGHLVLEEFPKFDPIPHALIPNVKKGIPKYNPPLHRFDKHLGEDLEPLCRYVIIRFHSALELFIWNRIGPFLNLEGLTEREKKAIRKYWQELDYRSLGKQLRKKVPLRADIPPKTADLAQVYRMLRNSIIHLHEQEYSDAHWSDTVLREKVKNTFSGSRRTAVMDEICENVSRNYGHLKETTPLFFYSLFMLTNYRHFADAVDGAVPQAPQSAGAATSPTHGAAPTI
jgi:hypothetical protein